MKQLRFAPIVRVSTEKQEKQGESLETQKKQIIRYVEQLGGVIPDSCWRYSGQEHATAQFQFERAKLELLLNDASRGFFDAVIICNADRWSRDNRKSKEGLQILKDNGILFFIGSTEINLFVPEQALFLGMSTEINEFLAQQSALKSIMNKVEKAKKNIPVCGKLPSGRTYDKKSGKWGIDPEFKKKIEYAANQLIRGNTLLKISQTIGMNRANLRNILFDGSGDIWTQHFRADRFKINEAIETKVPRLLTQDVIEKVKLRVQNNRTVFHKQLKNKYILGRMIMCGHCGGALGGNTRTERNNLQYYKHLPYRNCKHFLYVPAKMIEDAVLVHLFGMFGNQSEMVKAVGNAIPDFKHIESLESQIKNHEKELKKIERGKDRIIDMIQDGNISREDVKKRMSALKERESLLNKEVETIRDKIKAVPKKKEIKARADLLKAHIQSIYTNSTEFKNMGFEEKRKLCQFAFNGKDFEGNRSGVYVKKENDGSWSFEIKGILNDSDIKDYLPMDKEKANSILGIEDDKYNPFEVNTDGYESTELSLSRGDQP